MTNLDKLTTSERVDLCRKYFFIGLVCAPLVWVVNCFWFYKYAFCSQTNEEETAEAKRMKKYLILSAVGIVFWTVILSVWLYVYTASRAVRAEWADYITFIIPLGRV